MSRSDAPLIRHLAEKHSPATAREWQRPPLVLLPSEGFVDYLLQHEADLSSSMRTLDQLPWPDVVFDLQQGRAHLLERMLRRDAIPEGDRGQCWIRLRTLPRYRQNVPVSSPWMSGPLDLLTGFDDDGWIAVEAWEASVLLPAGGVGFPAYPDVSLVPVAGPWGFTEIAHLYPNLQCRSGRAFGDGRNFCNLDKCQFHDTDPRRIPCVGSELVMSSGVRLALLALAYLLSCDEHLVEVQPVGQPAEREQRTAKTKPWLRSLPHLILLDPQRAHEYGQPREGTGASEQRTRRPHGRRGHWRFLRAERFHRDPSGFPRRVWVRPAWIGPDEWEDAGQRYRVVAPAGSVADAPTP